MEPKQFIKLHLHQSNEPVIVNMSEVNTIEYDSDSKYSTIIFVNENESIDVMENVEKIYSIIYNTGHEEKKSK